MADVIVTTTWLLIVLFGTPESAVIHEFNSKDSCEQVLQEIRNNFKYADGFCTPKEQSDETH